MTSSPRIEPTLFRLLTARDGTPFTRDALLASLPETPAPDTLIVLRQKLQRHRVELLSTIGETEAYDEICTDLPMLQPSVQAQYNEAKDRSLKLLGRIRALETLIATQSSSAA